MFRTLRHPYILFLPLSFPRVNHSSRTQNIGFFIDFASLTFLIIIVVSHLAVSISVAFIFILLFSCVRSLKVYIKKKQNNKKTSLASRVVCFEFFINRARSAQHFSHTNELSWRRCVEAFLLRTQSELKTRNGR